MKLADKVAIVTGSSRGVGKNMAMELAREGCHIVVAARTEEVTDKRLPGTIHSVVQAIEDLLLEENPELCRGDAFELVQEWIRAVDAAPH